MGDPKSSGSDGANNLRTKSCSLSNETQVVLNVYDLTPINNYTVWLGFGIFHSGIEVHGMEYGYGAHDFSISGVFEVEPKTCPGFIYRCSIPRGCISMAPSDFRTFIESVASEYHGDTYHLISKNCNHFTDDIAWRLTGKRNPGWVNRLARLGSFCSCLLPESLQVTSVKKLPEYKECAAPQNKRKRVFELLPLEFIREEDGWASVSTSSDQTESDYGDQQDKHLLQ